MKTKCASGGCENAAVNGQFCESCIEFLKVFGYTDEGLLPENANQVPPQMACPVCGECDMDELMMDLELELIECLHCTHVYSARP